MWADAVIFDLDGLLIDSERLVKSAFEETVASLGLSVPPGLLQSLIGRNAVDSRRLMLERLGADFPHEECRVGMMARYEKVLEDDGMPVKAGARELLAFLHELGVPIALATSTAAERARYKLGLAGLDEWFPVLVGGDQILNGKPAPDIFLEAAERLNVTAADCVVFEDSYAGVRAAAAANMAPVMVPDQLPPNDEMRRLTVAIVDDLHDAKAFLSRRPGD